MANPNIVTTSSIYGKTDVLAVSTSAADITANAAASGKVLKINSLVLSNTTGSLAVDVDAAIFRNSTSYFFVKSLSVPADSTAVVVGKENPLYLLEGDSIRLTAGDADSIHAICSYEEIG